MSQAEWEEGLSRRDELESVLRDVLKMLAQHQGQQWQKSLGDRFKVWVNVVTVKRLVWKYSSFFEQILIVAWWTLQIHPDVTFSCSHDANANLSRWENATFN